VHRCYCPATGTAEGPPVQQHTDLCRTRSALLAGDELLRHALADLAAAENAVASGDGATYRASLAAAEIHRVKALRALGGRA
jgi:hypothetical protein